MSPKPRLLDLCCGAGGASQGYADAGFDVTGVDSAPQPRYPFRFIQAAALTCSLAGYDAIHASPPCEKYTRLNARLGYRHYTYTNELRARALHGSAVRDTIMFSCERRDV